MLTSMFCTLNRSRGKIVLESIVILTMLFTGLNSSGKEIIKGSIKKTPKETPKESTIDRNFDSFNMAITFDKIGQKTFTVIYKEPSSLFLPLQDLFNFLKIYNTVSIDGKSTCGYIGSEENSYEINITNVSVVYKGTRFGLSPEDYILDMANLFIKKDVLEKVFGFHIDFNFRALSARFSSDEELPLLKELRLEKARSQIDHGGDEIVVDTVIKRSSRLARFGMSDWSFSSTRGATPGETRVGLGIGAELLGGETNLWLNWSDRYGSDRRQQRYSWRWVDNHASVLKQLKLGRINTGSIASLLYPMDGFMLTNAPTTVRKAKGDYLISGNTEGDWTVELYLNDQLSAYTRADASGFYSFKVPVTYGTTNVTLRFYGPNGEERSEEKTYSLPYTMLPGGEFQYNIAGGELLDSIGSRYARSEFKYGFSRWLTLGGGFEYLSSIGHQGIPFLNFTFQPVACLVVSGEYAENVRVKGALNYSSPGNLTLQLEYAKYEEGQEAIIYKYLQERMAKLSVPVKIGKVSGFLQGTFRQNIYSRLTYNSGILALSTYYKRFSANLGNYVNWTNISDRNMYVNLSASERLGKNWILRPSVQYNYTSQEMTYYKVKLEKQVTRKGYLSLGYEDYLQSGYRSVNLCLRYDCSWMTSYMSSYFNGNKLQTTGTASGSLGFDGDYAYGSRNTTVGTSGISLIPYVDVNYNGKRDPGEITVPNLIARCNGGRVSYCEQDSITRITGLEPFVDYVVTLDESGFDNIAWQLTVKTMKICTDPNQFKQVLLPVHPVGELSGMVVDQEEGEGLGRILVDIYNKEGVRVEQVMSESDGYFTYLGLGPGNYIARVNQGQLHLLKRAALEYPFTIHQDLMGDVVDIGSISLYDLAPATSDSTNGDVIAGALRSDVKENKTGENGFIRSQNKDNEQSKMLIVWTREKFYTVQVGSFRKKWRAENVKTNLELLFKDMIFIVEQDSFYKVRVGLYSSWEEADNILKKLQDMVDRGMIFR